MQYIIKSKNIKLNLQKNYYTNLGNYFSNDRFYTLINNFIDKNLENQSRLLAFIIRYLFKTGNYKHDTFSNKKNFLLWLIDGLGFMSFICFIAMVISVIGLSFNKIPTDAIELSKFINGFITNLSANVTMLVFASVFIAFGVSWLIVNVKIRKKNKTLSLAAYVEKKINFIITFKYLLKTYNKATELIDKKQTNINVFCIHKCDIINDSTKWLNFQILDKVASIFNNFNLVFSFEELNNEEAKEIEQLLLADFENIEIMKIK